LEKEGGVSLQGLNCRTSWLRVRRDLKRVKGDKLLGKPDIEGKPVHDSRLLPFQKVMAVCVAVTTGIGKSHYYRGII